jgi:hypothetical protein
MTVAPDGKVGINQDEPQEQLDVHGNIKHGSNLIFYSPNREEGFIWARFTPADNEYGDNMYLGSGAVTVIGSGESAVYIKNAIDDSTGDETLYLGSDKKNNYQAVKIITSLQDGWNNRVEAVTILGNGRVGILNNVPKGYLQIPGDLDAGTNSSQEDASLVIGSMDDYHLEFDENEIHAMEDGSTTAPLYLNLDGGGIEMFSHTESQLTINSGGTTYALNLPNNANNAIGKARARSWVTYSDSRLKTDIRPLRGALELVTKMRPLRYFQHNSLFPQKDENGKIIRSKIEILPGGEYAYGFLAQDLYKILPEAVYKPQDESKDLWSIDYTLLIPVLTSAIQEQQKQIDELKKEVEELKRLLREKFE